MTKDLFYKELEQVTNRISTNYCPEKIILFGSAAKGNINNSSDLDLLIVKNTTRNPWDRILDVDKYIEHNLALDILVYTPNEIKKRIEINDFFIKDIMNNGKVLYAKSNKKTNH